MDINTTNYEKFIDSASDSTLHQTFNKPAITEVWWSIKKYPQLSGNTLPLCNAVSVFL